MKKLSLLIVTLSETQQRLLPVLLRAIFGQIDYLCADTLEVGLAQHTAGLPDLVLVDLAAGETAGRLMLAQLRALNLEHKCLLLADVAHWLEWRRGPWAGQVLLKGFSTAQLGEALNKLLPNPNLSEMPPG